MNEKLKEQIRQRVIKKQSAKRWQKITKVFAGFVVFCTTYALILPAITQEQKLYCGLEEHIHTEICFREEQILQCDWIKETEEVENQHVHEENCYTSNKILHCILSDSETTELHLHEEACYIKEKTQCCQLDEHEHNLMCYSNKTADLETSEIWEATLPSELSGNVAEDLVQVAESQLGYSESTENYEVIENEIRGYTRYGEWRGNQYNDWNKDFVAFCLYYAGIEETDIRDKTILDMPNSGDLIYISSRQDGMIDRIGIIVEVDEDVGLVKTIEGDSNNAVRYVDYLFEDIRIVGYGCVSLLEKDAEDVSVGETEESIELKKTMLSLRTTGSNVTAGKYGSYNVSYNDVKDAFITDDSYARYYNENSPLGTAGSFHLVAFNRLYMGTHTNGNVLAHTLIANSNFGTRNYPYELSYVMNYETVNGGSASENQNHFLVLGSENDISIRGNNDQVYINGTKIDSPHNIVLDTDTYHTPFIDLERVEEEAIGLSERLSQVSNVGVTVNFADENNRTITLNNPKGTGYYNTTALDLLSNNHFSDRRINIKGFSKGCNGSIVINVDCTGVTEFNMAEAIVYIDGEEQGTNEVTVFSAGKVVWNFINAEGVTINTKRMTGMVIAPGATVKIKQNLNGTVIAENIYVEAESHRTDFTGDIEVPEDHEEVAERTHITLYKVDKNNINLRLEGAKFVLYKWDSYQNDYVEVSEHSEIITNANGRYALDKLEFNTAYKLLEYQAPNGYELSGKEVEFMVTNSNTGKYPIRKPKDFAGKELITGNALYVQNVKGEEAPELTSITVEKQWLNRDGNQLSVTNGEISIVLWQTAYLDEERTIFETERVYNSSLKMEGPIWRIEIENLPKTGTEVIGKKLTKVFYSYFVQEIAVKDFVTTYENNEGIAEGTITIKNTDNSEIVYVLPDTGGRGIYATKYLGSIMIMTSLLICLKKKSQKKGGKPSHGG